MKIYEEKELTIPGLLDEFFEREQQLIKVLNGQPLDDDPLLEDLDEGGQSELQQLIEDRQDALYTHLLQKVDNTHEWLGHLEKKAERIAEDIKTLQDQKQATVNAAKNLKSYFAQKMKEKKIKVIEGNTWDMKLQELPTIKAKNIELTSDHYLELNEDEPIPVVKRAYSWDAKALKKAYKRNPDMFEKFVEVGKTSFIKFKGHN